MSKSSSLILSILAESISPEFRAGGEGFSQPYAEYQGLRVGRFVCKTYPATEVQVFLKEYIIALSDYDTPA